MNILRKLLEYTYLLEPRLKSSPVSEIEYRNFFATFGGSGKKSKKQHLKLLRQLVKALKDLVLDEDSADAEKKVQIILIILRNIYEYKAQPTKLTNQVAGLIARDTKRKERNPTKQAA